MPGPSPLNSACRCCINPPSTSLAIQYVSAWQSCTTTGCGELPCTSTQAVYDSQGRCQSPAQVCSPNWAALTRAEKCAAKRYLTITTVDTGGGGTHGRTQRRQYTIDAEGNCDLEVTCSGSSTTTTEINGEDSDSGSSSNPQGTYTYNYSCSHTETNITVRTYNTDCTVTETTTCSGSANYSSSSRTGYENTSTPNFFTSRTDTCTSTKNSNCGWTSTSTSLFSFGGGGTPNTTTGTNPCPCANYETTVTIEPTPNCQVSVTYTGENQQGYCTPKQFPSFPSFTQCTPEGQEPPDPPELQEGQGYESEAYKFVNPNNPQINSEQKVQYRVEHGPTGTCYLKVWFRKKIQQWKYEDCDTGFPGDPPRTPPAAINCNENGGSPCYSRWSTDGAPTYQDDGNYEWKGTGYPCYEDEGKPPAYCVNKIYGTQVKTLTAGQNQSITIEFKYSEVEDYEPNWPDESGSQGCKPNRFPIPNPEDCPEYNP